MLVILFFSLVLSFQQDNLARQAATWWAQFLPCVKNVDSSEIHGFKINNPERELIESLHEMQMKNCVPKEQVDDFINILQNKILYLEIEDYPAKHVTLGYRDSYHPPEALALPV